MRKTLLTVCCFSFIAVMDAQDPEFTQFYANPVYLNPAFAGTAKCARFNLNYRNQWPAISGTFVTYSASYDQHIDRLSGGIGLLVTNDRAGEGTLNTSRIGGVYSYQLNVSRSFSIKAGFQVNYCTKSLDWSRLTFGDQINDRRGFIYETQDVKSGEAVSYPDFDAGILGFGKKYFAGVAVHHITEPNESLLGGSNESPLPRKYTVHAGAMIPLEGRGGDAFLSPNILYQQQQDFAQLNLGVYASKGPVVGGLWYRNKDAFIALVGFQKGRCKFGYSYDVTVSRLSNATAGSHELSFSTQMECKPKQKKFRLVDCPEF